MFKKMITGALAGIAALGMVASASAASIEINMYGASAQYELWNALADDFLADAAYGNCGTVNRYEDASGKHGVAVGSGCTNTYGLTNGSMVLRYSSKASYDGIEALKGIDRISQCPTEGPKYRLMANENDIVSGVVNSTKCVDVTMGNSDVGGDAFTQSSEGALLGPRGGAWTTRSFSGIDTTGLTAYRPMVVPFGFFVNNSVKVKKCLYPDPTEPTPAGHKAMSRWGNVCYDPNNTGHSDDCIGYYKCIDGKCAGGVNANEDCTQETECPDVAEANTQCTEIPLDNISRLMAVMIYSGQAWYWCDFGAYFPCDPIVACLRHAGSGTHATLDWAVMRGADWGWGLVTAESAADPTVWFNDGSSDLMKCVDGLAGAIGYSDADKFMGSKNYENLHAINYQGVAPTREMVRNGWYDYWSAQYTYEDDNEPDYSIKHPVVVDLVAYASAQLPPGHGDFFATQNEMVYMKGADKEYPSYQGAPVPGMLP